MIALFREALAQKMHGSASVMLLQIEHSRTFSFASRIASDSANAWSLSTRSKKKARRCAVFCPMPGNRFNSSINRVTEGAKSGMITSCCVDFKREGNRYHTSERAVETR